MAPPQSKTFADGQRHRTPPCCNDLLTLEVLLEVVSHLEESSANNTGFVCFTYVPPVYTIVCFIMFHDYLQRVLKSPGTASEAEHHSFFYSQSWQSQSQSGPLFKTCFPRRRSFPLFKPSASDLTRHPSTESQVDHPHRICSIGRPTSRPDGIKSIRDD